ncbi:MAG: hypothetical protein IJF65_02105, partial [Clostridia bacterium]|nr:hypothetical protein [Clostridia bacterium]
AANGSGTSERFPHAETVLQVCIPSSQKRDSQRMNPFVFYSFQRYLPIVTISKSVPLPMAAGRPKDFLMRKPFCKFVSLHRRKGILKG